MSRPNPRPFVILLCGLMLAMNAISCDMLLPGFFAIEADLGAPIARVQAIIPLFLMAAAAGQIVFGPASDRFGRKPVLLIGIIVYVAGSLLGITAGTIEMLYVARVLQGTGAACAVVLARAILRDTHSGDELARAMALAMAIFAIGPLLAPLTGVGLIALGGWRATFVGLSLVGVALFSAVFLLYRETNLTPNPNALEFSSLRRAFTRVLTHPQSRQFLAVCVLLQIAVVLMVVNSPRIFKSAFDIEGLSFALLFAVGAIGIVVGQLNSNRLIARIGVLPTVRGAIAVLGVTSFLMWATAQTGFTSAAIFTVLLFVFNMTFLVVFTNSVSLVLDPHRDIAGVASALLGCITQLVGNVCALLLMPWIDGVMTTWSLVQLVLISSVVIAVWIYRPRLDVSRSATNN